MLRATPTSQRLSLLEPTLAPEDQSTRVANFQGPDKCAAVHARIARQRFSSMFKTCTSLLPVFSTAWVSAFRHVHSPALIFTSVLLPSLEVNFTVELLN